jgi:hypothetical protein
VFLPVPFDKLRFVVKKVRGQRDRASRRDLPATLLLRRAV